MREPGQYGPTCGDYPAATWGPRAGAVVRDDEAVVSGGSIQPVDLSRNGGEAAVVHLRSCGGQSLRQDIQLQNQEVPVRPRHGGPLEPDGGAGQGL